MTARLDLTKPLSAAALERAGACADQVALVRKHFGDEALPLTRERLRQAARLGLRVSWLARHLPPEQRRVFNAAMDEPERVFITALAESGRVFDAEMDAARRALYVATADALADALGLP